MTAARRYRRGGRRPVTGSDALGLLGRAARGPRIWLVAAAALGLSGGRFRRRAALRGMMAAGLASGLVRVVGARRPQPSWFPSGPAAAGFAFAAGAGQEVAALAPPLVAVAALAGYARVRAGAHDRSGTVAGAAVGAGTAVLTRRFWPVAPHEPAQVRTALEPSDVAPSPTGAGLVVVVNPSAGSSGRAAEELRTELPDAEVIELEEGDDLLAALDDAAARGCAVGVAGGDGSVNAAAAVAARAGVPLMVVPGGTLNHFAFALGVQSIADASQAVRDGRAVLVDRAVIDGHTFVNTASIGSYVDLVDAREQMEDRIGKWPAVVVALARVLRTARPVDLELDGVHRRVWMVFIGNCRYHPSGFAPSWRERLDDGLLDIRIVDGTRPWSRLRLLASVLTGRLARCGAYEQRHVRSVHVKSLEGPLRLARDGETFEGPEEFTIAKADDPLRVFVAQP